MLKQVQAFGYTLGVSLIIPKLVFTSSVTRWETHGACMQT
jgi:hypothetical protein